VVNTAESGKGGIELYQWIVAKKCCINSSLRGGMGTSQVQEICKDIEIGVCEGT